MLLQRWGTCESDDAGQLDYQYIYDDDDDGSVLIADCGNGRLQVMSEQGEFSVLQLQPPVSGSRRPVMSNRELYVTSLEKCAVYKLSIIC